MAQVLELRQESVSTIRQGIWINTRKYRRAEEAGSKMDLWAALANPMALRRNMAQDFASAIAAQPGVGEVWLTKLHDDLHVAVALEDPDVELEIRGTFIDLVCDRLDPGEGDLFVFPKGKMPDWVQRGEKLA